MQMEDPANGTNSLIGNVAFSPDGQLLAVGIDFWRLPSGERLNDLINKMIQFHSFAASSVAFHPDGSTLAVGTTRNSSRLLHRWRGKQPRRDQRSSKRTRRIAR